MHHLQILTLVQWLVKRHIRFVKSGIKQAELEFLSQHMLHQFIDLRFRHQSVFHGLHQLFAVAGTAQINVHTGFHSKRSGLGVVGSDARAHQSVDGKKVGDHQSFKTPVVAQDITKQPLVARAGDAVHIVVGGHHRLGTTKP